VSPVGTGDVRWSDLAAGDEELAAWCRARWLGPYRRLEELPDGFAATRAVLHAVAVHVVAPARQERGHGKMGLRWTCRGFGTPFFGDDEQIRVDGLALIRQCGDAAAAQALTTLAEAAAFVDVALDRHRWDGFDAPPVGDPAAPLGIDEAAAHALGDWYGFAWSVLEELRSEWAVRSPSRVQLWPEHFDAAFAAGPDGQRINVGCSPGDGFSAEPYVYVGPWDRASLDGPHWNAPFGAVLPYGALLAAEDQRGAALEFCRRGAAIVWG
jgi:hypothetical protein